MSKALTSEQKEQLALELIDYLISKGLFTDVTAYVNGRSYGTYDRENEKFYYNDKNHIVITENKDPRDCFEYVSKDNILSMSFEGPLYHVLNGYSGPYTVYDEMGKICEKYGCYFELGNAWNMTCYYL